MEAVEGLTEFPQPNAERQISCGRFVTYSRTSRKLTRSQGFLLDAHRPLGAVMRARKSAYFASTKHRGARAEPGAADWQSFDRPPVTASPAS